MEGGNLLSRDVVRISTASALAGHNESEWCYMLVGTIQQKYAADAVKATPSRLQGCLGLMDAN